MKFFQYSSSDSMPDQWAKLLLMWLGTMLSRESLSYVALLLTLLYTALLLATLVRKEWWPRVPRATDTKPPKLD